MTRSLAALVALTVFVTEPSAATITAPQLPVASTLTGAEIVTMLNPRFDHSGDDLACPGGSVACTVNQVLGTLPTAIPLTSPAFGAVPNVKTAAAATANAAAFIKAFALGHDVYCPSGATFYTTGMTMPANAASLTGKCKLIAGPNFVDGNPVLRVSNTAGALISGVETDADLTAYPTSYGIFGASNSNLVVRDFSSTAAFGIADSNSINTLLENPTIAGFVVRGIYIANPMVVTITKAKVIAPNIRTSHCISFSQGAHITVTASKVYGCGGFGYSFAGTPSKLEFDVTATSNRAYGTKIEAMNFTDVNGGSATGNVFTFNADSTDFGASFAGGDTQVVDGTTYTGIASNIIFTGNTIIGNCKAGTAIAGNSSSNNISGNKYVNVGACVGQQASFTGSVSTSGMLTVTAVASGTIGQYDALTGAGIPNSDAIKTYGTGGTTGTGGVGTYMLTTAPSASVTDETITSIFTDQAHSNMAVLLYGPANNNTVGPNVIQDLYSPPHLAYGEGEFADGGTPNLNSFISANGTTAAACLVYLLGASSSKHSMFSP